MIQIQTILCPVDLSDASRDALDYAALLARWYSARLRVLFVAPPLPPVAAAPFHDRTAAGQLRRVLVDELDRFVASVRASGLHVDVTLGDGPIVQRILAEADSMAADLIVMGTHGRGGFEHFIIGSVTEKVLRKATCPVLTVPPGVHAASGSVPRFTTILAAVDFSHASEPALHLALSLAQEADSKLTLFHVIEWPDLGDLLGVREELARAQRERMDQASARLRALVPDAARDWCHPEPLVVVGKPGREIIRAATETGADLIVMGTHSRDAVSRVFFGSTANSVVRSAPCAVLTVPPGGRPIPGA
ncbi:MAG: universal stress protein [Vicinamibacterales bacterium]